MAQTLLAGQRALVTGASSGIGLATALALGKAGADVALNYVAHHDQAEAAAAEIRRSGTKALLHRADVSSESEVRAMFRRETHDTVAAFFASRTRAELDALAIEKDLPIHTMTA